MSVSQGDATRLVEAERATSYYPLLCAVCVVHVVPWWLVVGKMVILDHPEPMILEVLFSLIF